MDYMERKSQSIKSKTDDLILGHRFEGCQNCPLLERHEDFAGGEERCEKFNIVIDSWSNSGGSITSPLINKTDGTRRLAKCNLNASAIITDGKTAYNILADNIAAAKVKEALIITASKY